MCMGLWHEYIRSRSMEENKYKPNIPLLDWRGNLLLNIRSRRHFSLLFTHLQQNFLQILQWYLVFYLQNLKSDLSLWQLGTLPPGLIAFHGHVHVINPFWHMLGLGYQDNTTIADAESAGVVHFNGRAKPWLDIAFPQLRPLWTKYLNFSDRFIKSCHIRAS